MAGNENYTVTEEYVLPSGGKIYDKMFDPHIQIRPMKTMEEMRRQSPSNNTNRVLCDIIDACLITKLPVKTYDLCLGDFTYLLNKLRVATYGPDYKFTVGCPHCNQVYESSMNLDNLKVKEFDLNEFMDLLKITLPDSKKEVKLKYSTPRISDEITAKVKEFKKKTKVDYDPTLTITLQSLIDTVDDTKYDFVSLENFVNNLTAKDARALTNRIAKINDTIGLDTRVDITCDKCGGDIITFFRFSSEFFEPTEID